MEQRSIEGNMDAGEIQHRHHGEVVDVPESFAVQPTNNIFNFDGSSGININPEFAKHNHLHIHPGEKNENLNSPNTQMPIERVKQPVSNFQTTALFARIHENIRMKSVVILHCHGFSGSGKSQTVLKLAEDFPFTVPNLYIKWHIECDNKNHDIKEELKELVVQMQQQLNISMNYQSILSDIDKDVTISLIKAFHRCNIPVLIIIEIANSKSKHRSIIIEDLLRSVKTVSQSPEMIDMKLHIYLTSHSKSFFLSDEEQSKMTCYQMESIIGFGKEEGVSFLLENKQSNSKEKISAGKVYERFSGSPLGLQVAKAYCTKTMLDYFEYLQLIEENCEESIQADEEVIAKQFGPNAQHVFQAITLPFQNEMQDQSNKEAILIWKILVCLSYYHHDQIPRFLVEGCFEYLRDTNHGKNIKLHNKLDSGKLINRLIDYAMCTKQVVQKLECITFHQVVLHAFYICQGTDTEKKFDHAKNALWIMAGLLNKDLRFKETLNKMTSLIPHLQTLLNDLDGKETKLWKENNDLMVKVGIAHLYEMAGAITMRNFTYKKYSDQYFKKAIELLWNHENLYSLSNPNKLEVDVDKVADCVITQCDLEANQLSADFVAEFQPKILMIPFNKQLEAIKNYSSDKEKFEKMLKAIHLQGKKKEIINLLQECNLYLDAESHRKVFFAERIASLLHSWSRVALYRNQNNEGTFNYLWMSSLSHAISVECRTRHGIKLFSEFLSIFTGKIQIICQTKCLSLTDLNEAKSICETRLNMVDEIDLSKSYEYGWLITPHTPSDSEKRMRIIRGLVPIYNNIVKLPNQNTQAIISQGNKYCEELLDFASDHINESTNALMWVIQCAKFYASSQNIDLAMSCFDKYFEMKELNSISFQSHPWAIYNFAKIVLSENREEYLTRAIEKVQDLFDSQQIIENVLHQKLCSVMERLQEMQQTSELQSTCNAD